MRPGGAMVAVEPGLWHPVGLGLAIANRAGAATAIHGTPDDIPLSPGRLGVRGAGGGSRPGAACGHVQLEAHGPRRCSAARATRRARLEAASGPVRPHADADRAEDRRERAGEPRAPVIVVCITPAARGELLSLTLESVRAHTPAEVPVVVLGSATAAGPHRGTDGTAGTSSCSSPAASWPTAWLDGLADAAASAGVVATVSALTHQDVNSTRGPASTTMRRRRARARFASGHGFRPPAGPCVYVRRSALELIGAARRGASRPRRALPDVHRGRLLHVLADDVLVFDRRPGPGHADREPAGNRAPSQARAVGKIRRAIAGLSAVIDARILYGSTTGTHVHVLEVVAGLARTGKVRLTVIVPGRTERVRARRVSSPSAACRSSPIGRPRAHGGQRADVVHRPFPAEQRGRSDVPEHTR